MAVYTLSDAMRFNSLQTGKRIQSFIFCTKLKSESVSIPFKRESVFKVIADTLEEAIDKGKFQFPSNGKVDSKDPILSPVGPWLRTPKTIRELRGTIFERNFSPKIP